MVWGSRDPVAALAARANPGRLDLPGRSLAGTGRRRGQVSQRMLRAWHNGDSNGTVSVASASILAAACSPAQPPAAEQKGLWKRGALLTIRGAGSADGRLP